jgi:hypothetical protein
MVIIPRSSRSFSPSLIFILALVLLVLLPVFSRHHQLEAAAHPSKDKNRDYALLIGTVWGPDDRPIFGVKIKIRRAQDKRPKWELVSDHRGEFAQRVPAGKADYVIWADTKGLKTADGKPLHLVQQASVHVDYDERVDIGLHLTN